MWPRVSVVVVTKSAVWVWVVEGPEDILPMVTHILGELPIYGYSMVTHRVWVIWVFGIFTFFQKWLDSFWLICSFKSHLSTYGDFLLAIVASWLSCVFVINVFRLRMAPSCVVVGQLASQ